MPLHIDYRPRDFNEIKGNLSLIQSLQAIFDREKDYPHAILLQGPSGCGKTTIARIIRDLLKCNKEHDYLEINASNNRGIDTAREILKTMQLKPMAGPVRVYLLDECHQVTKDFQHSLLKVLEDTPSHVYFILCTTEPEKLLATIRNRCSSFQVKPLSERQMASLIKWVLEEEGINDIPDDIVNSIVDVAEGCPRQALVTLDQIIDLDIKDMARAIQDSKIESRVTKDLIKALLNKDSWKNVAQIIKQIDDEPEKVRRAIIGYISAIALNGSTDSHLQLIYECFKEPNFYNKKAGLTFACMEVIVGL